jgi:hypothetical protein
MKISVPFLRNPGDLAARTRGVALAVWKRLTRRERPPAILPPFKNPPLSRGRYVTRAVLLAGLVLFCLIYGSLYAMTTPFLLVPFFLPLLVLTLVVIWALPDFSSAPTAPLRGLFYAFTVVLVAWPVYLAIALPGLPWITLTRLTSTPYAILLLLCLKSPQFRADLGQCLRAAPWIWKLVVAFAVLMLVSVALSEKPTFSLQKFIIAQFTLTAMFFGSAYIFRKPGSVERWAMVIWGLAVFLALMGIWESRVEHVLWVGHIPSFLKIDDPAVQRTLAGASRAYVDKYRVQGTYTGPLGFGEFIALSLPFVLHFATSTSYRIPIRLAAAASVLLLFVVALRSGARLAMVGVFLAFLVHVFAVAITVWKRNRESIFGPAVALGYPAFFCLAVASVFFVGRIRNVILGDGSQDSSNDARMGQIALGMPKLLHRPIGYGAGMGAETVGFAPFGSLTIDNYYLAVAIEYGVIGFIVFYGLVIAGILAAGRRAYADVNDDRDYAFLWPLASSLLIFLVIKAVFSEQDNHPLIFMMYGAVAALAYRGSVIPQRQGLKSRVIPFKTADAAPAFASQAR